MFFATLLLAASCSAGGTAGPSTDDLPGSDGLEGDACWSFRPDLGAFTPCGGEGGSGCTLPDSGPDLVLGKCAGLQGPCVDTVHDADFCGPSFTRCRPGGSCVQGTCVYSTCEGIPVDSACLLPGGGRGACCGGACQSLDFGSDASHCGGCGVACPSGSVCTQGTCGVSCDPACAAGAPTCGACPAGRACGTRPDDKGCVGASCHACLNESCGGIADGLPCVLPGLPLGAGGTCCGGACVDTTGDPGHCGGCGIRCCGQCQAGTCF